MFFGTPNLPHVDSTCISWDALELVPCLKVLQDEDYFSLGSPGWKGFGEVIKSISVPLGRINNPLSLVMDVSLSCSARIPSSPRWLFQPALSDEDLGLDCDCPEGEQPYKPPKTYVPASTLPSAWLCNCLIFQINFTMFDLI